jgi:RNA polymerase-binding protein DksA
MYNKKLEYFKNRLLEERKNVLEALEGRQNNKENTLEFQDRELSSYDNHPADIATEVYMMEQDKGFQDQYRDTIEEIDKSLEDIENNNYGYCSNCDKMIGEERLEIIPYAKTCLKCSDEDQEGKNRKEVLDNRGFKSRRYETLDHATNPRKDNVGYDKNDIYQDTMQDNLVLKDPSFSTGDNMEIFDEDENENLV